MYHHVPVQACPSVSLLCRCARSYAANTNVAGWVHPKKPPIYSVINVSSSLRCCRCHPMRSHRVCYLTCSTLQAYYFLGRMAETVTETVYLGTRYHLYEQAIPEGAERMRMPFSAWCEGTEDGGNEAGDGVGWRAAVHVLSTIELFDSARGPNCSSLVPAKRPRKEPHSSPRSVVVGWRQATIIGGCRQ